MLLLTLATDFRINKKRLRYFNDLDSFDNPPIGYHAWNNVGPDSLQNVPYIKDEFIRFGCTTNSELVDG